MDKRLNKNGLTKISLIEVLLNKKVKVMVQGYHLKPHVWSPNYFFFQKKNDTRDAVCVMVGWFLRLKNARSPLCLPNQNKKKQFPLCQCVSAITLAAGGRLVSICTL